MTTQVLRPDSTSTGASNFTVTGGASAQVVLADDSDASYIRKSGTGQKSIIVGLGNYTVLGTETIKQVRLRARTSTPTSSGKMNLQLGTRVNGINYFFPALTVRGTTATGEISSAWQTASPDGASWDQSRLDALRCQITEYRDTTDRGYIYELYVDVQTTSRPTVTVDAPTGTITTTAKPDISWTFADTDGEAQSYYEIKVFSSAQYGVTGFDPSLSTYTWTSGQVASSDASAQTGTYLSSGSWRAYVRVAKTVNGAAFFSEWAYSAFTLTLTPPTTPTLTLSYSSTFGNVTATIDGAYSASFSYQRMDLQRSDDGGSTWAFVRNGSSITPDGSFNAVVVDYEAKRGTTANYRCRAVGFVGDNVIASAWSSASTVSITNDGKWWLKAMSASALNVGGVRVLTGLDMQQEEELAVFRPIGRTRAVVVSGSLGGKDGSYSIVSIGDAEWASVYGLISHQGTLLVQAPDGTQKYIRIINRTWSETGGVGALRREARVQYVEVDE